MDFYSNASDDRKEILSGVDRSITLFYYKKRSEGNYNVTEGGRVIIFWNSTLAKYVAYPSYISTTRIHKQYPNNRYTTFTTLPLSFYQIEGVSRENGSTTFDECSYAQCDDNIHYLADKNRKEMKKVFQYTNCFTYLSVDGYLDNNPNNFPHGTIKDAWVCNETACVQTMDNQLYQYTKKTKTWELLGTYDMKKIEISPSACIFILTNDGKLYYKGSAIKGLIDIAHETLTQIFPELTFMDFTFNGNTLPTLAVLRE